MCGELTFIFTRSKTDRKGLKITPAFGIGTALAGGTIALVITAFASLRMGASLIAILQAGVILYVVGTVRRETIKSLKGDKANDRISPTPNRKR